MAKITTDIKTVIKEKCREKQISSDQLANRLGLSRPLMYYHINKGNFETLKKIDEILGTETESFVDSSIYNKLERQKIRLNVKRKKLELILSGIKSSIQDIEKQQDELIRKKQPKLF